MRCSILASSTFQACVRGCGDQHDEETANHCGRRSPPTVCPPACNLQATPRAILRWRPMRGARLKPPIGPKPSSPIWPTRRRRDHSVRSAPRGGLADRVRTLVRPARISRGQIRRRDQSAGGGGVGVAKAVNQISTENPEMEEWQDGSGWWSIDRSADRSAPD